MTTQDNLHKRKKNNSSHVLIMMDQKISMAQTQHLKKKRYGAENKFALKHYLENPQAATMHYLI